MKPITWEYKGKVYTEEQLSEAFDKVADPKDWKNPIRAQVDPKDDLELIEGAIMFFTATQAKFIRISSDELIVRAQGYYLGPAH